VGIESTEKKSDHQVNIVRLCEPRVHTNADTLELFDIGGYQVVTKKGQFKEGDLAVYVQPDSVVPQTEAFRFIWGPYAEQERGIISGEPFTPAVGERRRRITVRRFRKEVSEGLLMPVTDFPEITQRYYDSGHPVEGEDVSDLIGVMHYEGDQDVEPTDGINHNPKRKYPRTLKGWVYFVLYHLGFKGVRRNMNVELSFDVPKFDVENFKNHHTAIKDGEDIIVTEKLHGSQARYIFKEGIMYAGSRNLWKDQDSPCVWRKALQHNPWIEQWCRMNEGCPLYGEVVPTQKGYSYGCKPGEVKFFVFDVRGIDGNYIPKKDLIHGNWGTPPRVAIFVPVLYEGPYNAEEIVKLVDGVSAVDGKTQREGIVITATDPTRWERGIGRVQLKWKSSAFLEKDGNR